MALNPPSNESANGFNIRKNEDAYWRNMTENSHHHLKWFAQAITLGDRQESLGE